ncbi:MAG: T9SS type A sorting domain-containing protein [Bacteroidetes bacterium]|nr:T9SS type A sorting domain-containing protein [Bacteroidota bacterium]
MKITLRLFFLLVTTQVFAQIPDPHAYYPFDGDILDYSGNEFHLSNLSPFELDYTCNRFLVDQDALELDQSAVGIGLMGDSLFQTSHISISVWILPKQNYSAFLFKGIDSKPGQHIGYYMATGRDITGAGVSDDCGPIQDFDGFYTEFSEEDVCWQHLVMTYDENLLKLYKNGLLINQIESEAEINNCEPIALYIGKAPGFNVVSYYSGVIDDVMIFDEALTDSEVEELHLLQVQDAIPCVACETTGTELNITNHGIIISPLPAQNFVQVHGESFSNASIEIIGLDGTVVKVFNNTNLPGELDVSTLDKGLYLILIRTENQTSVHKMIKQ